MAGKTLNLRATLIVKQLLQGRRPIETTVVVVGCELENFPLTLVNQSSGSACSCQPPTMDEDLAPAVDSLADALRSYIGRSSAPFKAQSSSALNRLTEVVEQTPESNSSVT